MLAFKLAIVDQFQCILLCVRTLLAKHPPFSTTSETLSYTGLGEEKRELKGTRITKGTTGNTGDKENQREKGREKREQHGNKEEQRGEKEWYMWEIFHNRVVWMGDMII